MIHLQSSTDMNQISSAQSLRCIQANLRHSRLASLSLSKLILDMKIDIVLIQEPYVTRRGKSLHIPYFSKHYQVFQNLHQTEFFYGSIILVRNGLRARMLQCITENHIVGIEISADPKNLYFLSIYCRPSSCLTDSIRGINNKPLAFFNHTVIAIDSNAHNTLWNSTHTDARGEILETFASGNNLSILNTDSSDLNLNTSFIDVTFGGDNIVSRNWSYLSDDSLSDHPLIFFDIQ